jgi:hypothetical protein
MLLVLLCMRDTKSDGSAAVGVSAVAQRCTSRIPLELAGAPEEIRTPDPQIRSLGRAVEIIEVRYRKKGTAP